MGIILKLATPSGMPMTVMHRARPVVRWPSASQIPATMIQMTLPTVDAGPAVGLRTTVRPKGHSA